MNNIDRSPARTTRSAVPKRDGFQLAVARSISGECLESLMVMVEHAMDLKCYGLHKQSAQLAISARSLAKRLSLQSSPELDWVVDLCNRLLML